jgi:hypothetical protein
MILETPSSSKEREHERDTRAKPHVARRVKPSKTVKSPEAAPLSSESTTIANVSTAKSRRKVKSDERLRLFQKALVD